VRCDAIIHTNIGCNATIVTWLLKHGYIVTTIPRSKEGKKEYLYSAIYTMHSLKALRRGSHSFTCKITPCLPFLHKCSPDGATLIKTQVADIQLQLITHLATPKG